MRIPLQIEFDGLEPSDAVSEKITRRAEHLETLFPKIVDGRVVVARMHHKHRKGNIFSVRIELTVPGDRLVISHEPGDDPAHSDVYVAVRDSFDAMQRRLQDYVRKMRGETKRHEDPLAEGKVCRIFPYEGFGFIATADEREVYFDKNAVLGSAFAQLDVGSHVRFCEELGEKGPQATTVHA